MDFVIVLFHVCVYQLVNQLVKVHNTLIVIRRANFNVAKIAHKSDLVTYRSLIIIRSCLMRNVSCFFFLSFFLSKHCWRSYCLF